MSALVYQGSLPGFTFGADFHNKFISQQVSISYQQGNLSNDINTSILASKTVGANYTVMLPIASLAGVKINGGLEMQTFLATRKHNQFINNRDFFEFAGSMALSIDASYSISRQHPLIVKTRLTSPFISNITRSGYVNNDENTVQQPQFSTYVNNIYVTSFGGYTAVNWQTVIEKHINPKHTIGIGYTRSNYQMKHEQEVTVASNTLFISYSVGL
ncbi:hypothetical protein IM792_01740 [Mucilaginibacter sp. JRF]|uniref:hypothetical protein n=1 Tax=Mucilaginibacter sp. JRF TaxID=2780088 RepID=UPI0018828FB3|nr:hypothetical protein [Mucilaginibacter sp. JRF]MBE9583162.1 hypothetical protein [Mucilaginibacter sp. JRF]